MIFIIKPTARNGASRATGKLPHNLKLKCVSILDWPKWDRQTDGRTAQFP